MTRRTFSQDSAAVWFGVFISDTFLKAANTRNNNNTRDAWKTLEVLSQAADIERRKYAAAAYAVLAAKNSEALKLATQMLAHDKDFDLRIFAASALGQERCRTAIPALRKALDDPSTGVVFAASKALWDMDDHSAAAVFREVLLGERRDTTGFLTGYLEDARHKLHQPKQLIILGMNEAVSSFLGPAGMVLTLAEENVKDKGAPARALAAAALARDRSQVAKNSLESALQDSAGLVRASACRSLALLGHKSSLPYIEPLLSDRSEAARSMASAAYLRITMHST